MKLAAMFGSSSGAIGVTAVGAVVVVAGAVGFTVFNGRQDPPGPQPMAAAIEETPEASTPDADPAPAPAGPTAEAPEILAPRLDLVRVDPDGGAVIAGRTSPDMTVAVLLDGVEIAQTRADGAGDFVALITLAPSDVPRLLSVEARPEGGPALAGIDTVLVAPFGAAAPEAAPEAVAAAEPAQAPALDAVALAAPGLVTPPAPDDAAPSPEVTTRPPAVTAAPENIAQSAPTPDAVPGSAPEPMAPGALATGPAPLAAPSVASAPADISPETRPAAPEPARAMAPSVVIASPEGLRVLQGPAQEPTVQTSVRLDAISYDSQGAVILAGRGPVSANIQITLNNQPIQLGEVGPGGDWSLQLPDVDPGTYTLAVAELAEDGTETSRVETPFLREDPVRVAEAPAQQAAGIDVITVQPDFTLWGIARDTFGDGILYVHIFEENRDQIRDPDRIFPGQIFRLPEIDEIDSAD